MPEELVQPGYLILLTISIFVAGIVALFLSKSMLQAAEFPDPQPLVIALALLTLIALIGALVTGNENAYTLAATGIGAIAGAVTATWSARKDPPDSE